MLKQKSGLGFKPKAPPARRSVQASPQLPERLSTDERQSQTPVPPSSTPEPQHTLQSSARPAGLTAGPPASVARGVDGAVSRATNTRAEDAPSSKRVRIGQPLSLALNHDIGQENAERSRASTSDAPATTRVTRDDATHVPRKVTPIAPPTLPPSARHPSPPRISTTPIPLPASVRTFQPAQAPSQTPQPTAVTADAEVPARNRPRPSIETAENEGFPVHKASGGGATSSEVVVETSTQPTDSSAGTKIGASGRSRVSQQSHRRGRQRRASDVASHDSDEEEEQGNDEVQQVDNASLQSGADAPNEEANADGATKKRRKRSVTPEDAENIEVDPRQVKMADLAKDLKIGKKFERHDQIKQREKERRSRIRLERKLRLKGLQPANADGSQATEASPSASAGAAGDTQPDVPLHIAISYDAATATAPQFEVIDGQIVVNQQSLQVDRHAAAAAEAGEMAQVEEDEFSRRVTSASYRRKPLGPNHWTYNETERFYRALAMFGTNFQMISQMFPNKDRRQVKLKFNREERFCPKRVNAALIGEHRTEIDLDEFREYADLHLETVEEIQADLKTREDEHEATERRKEEEAAETAARKRAELYAGREAENEASHAEGAESGKAKTRRKRGPRKKAAEVDTGFGI